MSGNDWTQPICRTCFAAFSLGQGRSPHREPTRVLDSTDVCLICGDDCGGIHVRVDPALTEGLRFAREREP